MASRSKPALSWTPMVSDPTRSQSESIQTVYSRLKKGRLVIPDYQREADQWDDRKESLFLESILNNLTIPAFFFAETDANIEVVDGQQRLNTIAKFIRGETAISDDESMVYLSPQSVHYAGKKYNNLHPDLKTIFDEYPLTIIYLPKLLEQGAKLEIFRRINEGGTPLTAQDIRLSYYSESTSVTFVRLAGVHADTQSSRNMLAAAKARGVVNPWESHPKAKLTWHEWWEEKAKSRGQTPSEMFLWFLVARYRDELQSLIATPDSCKHLQLTFRGSTEEALDIFCAQLAYTDKTGKSAGLPILKQGLKDEFENFVLWMSATLGRGLAGLSVDKYKQMALLFAAMVELDLTPKKLNQDHWDAFGEFIRQPRSAGQKWLKGDGYPEQKGRWSGTKGQKAQCDRVVELVQAIVQV
jgi:Protein of unknown function DUF262